MATGRIIHKELFLNEDLSEINIEERFLYIGMIVYSDDDGRMKASPAYLRATIFSLDIKISLEKIKLWRDVLVDKKLIGIYISGGKEYIYHPNWTKWQSLRKDRYHPSDCPSPDSILPLGNHLATNGQPSANEPNLTEPNRTEVALSASPSFEKNKSKNKGVAISDEEFMKALKNNEAYNHINIDMEMGKMDAWLLAHKGRQKTRGFIVNWLNKIDRPVITKREAVPL